MAGREDRRDETRGDGQIKERPRTERKEPALYAVVLLNDDYTPMQFVVEVLESIFQRSPAEAYRVMMQVHTSGRGIAGTYGWEVAETKVDALLTQARTAGHPLQATIEEA